MKCVCECLQLCVQCVYSVQWACSVQYVGNVQCVFSVQSVFRVKYVYDGKYVNSVQSPWPPAGTVTLYHVSIQTRVDSRGFTVTCHLEATPQLCQRRGKEKEPAKSSGKIFYVKLNDVQGVPIKQPLVPLFVVLKVFFLGHPLYDGYHENHVHNVIYTASMSFFSNK